MTRATWSEVAYSYPCPSCDAGPGVNCRAYGGAVLNTPHAARVATIDRCGQCHQWVHAEARDQGLDLCEACLALVRDG